MNSIERSRTHQTHTGKITRWAAALVLMGAITAALTVAFISPAAQPDKTATPGSSRYQISAFGNPNGHGAYVLDTWTGEVWLVGQFPMKKIADGLK